MRGLPLMKWSKDDAGRQGRFCFLKMLESGSSKTPCIAWTLQKVFVDFPFEDCCLTTCQNLGEKTEGSL